MKKVHGVILISCIVSGALSALVYRQIPQQPKYVPAPIVQAAPTEDEAIVEVHRALEHNKPPKLAQTADEYLCEVYQRTPIKKDGAGDFTWKDHAAAKRLGMNVCDYAIGGMDPELKAKLVMFGKVADAKGNMEWSIFSAFRDDYRQSIASGYKARTGNSVHGNSRATKGYGHGRAIDIAAVGPIAPVLALMDKIGRELGLTRPMKGGDPNHVQLSQPTRLASVTPQKQRVAKVAKHKTRYAKRIKHRTRIAVRQHDDFASTYFYPDHGSTRTRHHGKVPRSRRA